ncbi:NAD-dependent epimerase/dehydratase family protein [Actinoplanes sp. CA-015351]|uniref:NAD-dependent epimerase/dehydratase family protein n=1 Tax=Actinoplanes sp. CA-015351 TaxID=3239897 RepID=UPI003D976EA6
MERRQTWIVTGGAGYIGAHVVHRLRDRCDVVVLDDLSTGNRDRLPPDVPLVEGSVTSRDDLDRVLRRYPADGVVHLAARKLAGESQRLQELYEAVNVTGVRHLLEAMRQAGVGRLLQASSAAVYGGGHAGPVRENDDLRPLNHYGATKLAAERIIQDASRTGLRALVFRQFNVIGAGTHPYAADVSPQGLLPSIFRALTTGPELVVLGRRFATPDGTAVRDYVHVADIADAFARGVELLSGRSAKARTHSVVNLGSGRGASVAEVVDFVGQMIGQAVPRRVGPKRRGDAAEVVAAVEHAAERGFECRSSLEDAVVSAWLSWQTYVTNS